MPGVLVQAVGVGRPALVTAGTAPAEEMPEGVVVPVDPGPRQDEDLFLRLRELLGDERLRDAIGDRARAHARAYLGVEATAARVAALLAEVDGRRAELLGRIQADRFEDGSLGGYLADEIRHAARDLGLAGWPLGLEPLLEPLAPARRGAG
jgi:phosphoglycolate phosphatase-like HAD superfamily hydrolase